VTTRRVRVGDVLRLERRPVTVDPLRDYQEIGVRSFGRGIFHKEPVAGAELGVKRVFGIEPGDLVVSNVFAWEGAVALASERESGMIGSHRFMTYVPRDERLLPAWAAWFFVSEPGVELLGAASPGSAGRNRTLAIERFENLEIPVPSRKEQVKVAVALDRIAAGQRKLEPLRARAEELAASIPLSMGRDLAPQSRRTMTPLRDALVLVREAVDVDPLTDYVTLGIKSFGRGAFHYPERKGSEIGKLRFFQVQAGLLAVSNITGWEGGIATTTTVDEGTVASNRFLFFQPRAGADAVHYFWALLLSPDGLAAIGRASPGSTIRNRTLGLDRFLDISLPLAPPELQVKVGRQVGRMREAMTAWAGVASDSEMRLHALLSSALNQAFNGRG